MKFSNDEYRKALIEAYDLLSDLQSGDQNEYDSVFDRAMSTAQDALLEEDARIQRQEGLK